MRLARLLALAVGIGCTGGCIVTTAVKVTTTAVGASVKTAGAVARGTAHVAGAALKDEDAAAAAEREQAVRREARDLTARDTIAFWEPGSGYLRRVRWQRGLDLRQAEALAGLTPALAPVRLHRSGDAPQRDLRPTLRLERGDVIELATLGPTASP